MAQDVIYYYYYSALQSKVAGRKIMVATTIYSVAIVVERNRISSLQSHGNALNKECCLPGVSLLLLHRVS